jgi:hypothetical protein
VALAIVGVFASLPAAAQQPATVFPAEYPSAAAAKDPATSPSQAASSGQGNGVILAPQDLVLASAPFWCDVYMKGGLVFPIGRGPLPDQVRTGWAMQFGVRELITSPGQETALFLNFGGGYVENHGGGSAVVTSGFLHGNEPSENQIHPLNDFFATHIREMQRGNLLVSLDGEYYPARWNQLGTRRVHFDVRGGMRIGALHVDYDQTPTPALNNLIPTITGHRTLEFTNNAAAFDQPFGLFTSVGVGVTYADVQFWVFHFADVSLQAELEFAHDWINLGDYAHGERSLWTVSPLLALTFTF